MLDRPVLLVLLLVSVCLVCPYGFIVEYADAATERRSDCVNKVLEKSVTQFTLDLDKAIDQFRDEAIRDGNTTNIILSPLNLVNTLAIIRLDALGITCGEKSDASDFRQKLFIECNSEIVHQVFEHLIDNICAHEENSLKPLITSSTAVFSKIYNVSITEFNMSRHPDEATDQINRWLNETMLPGMNGNIILPLISTKSDAAIAATLNFNGTRHIMKLKSIKKERFMISLNKSVLVDMVYTEGHGRYYRDEELDMEIIELPYNPDPNEDYNYMRRTSMYILKPLSKDPRNLIHVKKRLTPKIIEDMLGKLMYMYIDLHIPTFNLSSTLNLKQELVSMNSSLPQQKSKHDRLSKNFQHSSDTGADFEFPNQSESLHSKELKRHLSLVGELIYPSICLSHFFHKVNVEFTETGTIASSATVGLHGRSNAKSDFSDYPHRRKRFLVWSHNLSWTENGIMEVDINQPFLFFIKHDPTNLILFWGTVYDPTSN